MQGVRRAEAQLGETACVIGLGLIGQLVVRLLVASGVRVVGVDTVPDRCRMAEAAGAVSLCRPRRRRNRVSRAGARHDHRRHRRRPRLPGRRRVANGPVELAARLARDRARVVDIGKTRLDLPWNAYYEKELDVRFSRSYGPGATTTGTSSTGIDYPVGYVRWTERRNLQCFLDLLSTGSLEVGSLVSEPIPSRTPTASTTQLRDGTLRGVGHLFEYDECRMPLSSPGATSPSRPASPQWHQRPVDLACAASGASLRLATVGRDEGSVALDCAYQPGNGAARLHRRGQLRHLDAAAAPRRGPLATLATVATTRSCRRQCAAEVRLRARHDGCRCGPRRPGHRRRLRRHAPPLPRGLRVPCARRGQGRLRREALGAHSNGRRPSPRSRRATGNDRLMVGFNRRFAPLFTCSASDSAR